MRLLCFRNGAGEVRLGGVDCSGTVRDLTESARRRYGTRLGDSPIRNLLVHNVDLGALRDLVPGAPAADVVEYLPPVGDPGKVIAAPVNYVDHQNEMSSDSTVEGLGVFLKAPTSMIGHRATVVLPYHDRRFDQEGELGVVVGRTARNVADADAMDVVAGYSCLLDMTMRGGEDRSVRKSFDTFTPVGPYLVTPDEVPDIGVLELRTWVAGELRQWVRLRDLIWEVPKLIAYASSVMTLHPGDMIATGTPAGVGPVHHGDEVVVEITGMGRLEVSVDATGAVACPTTGRDRGPRPPDTVTRPTAPTEPG